MIPYILRRLLFAVPTLFLIIVLNFMIVQVAPGGPVEHALAQWQGEGGGVEVAHKPSSTSDFSSSYRGRQGLNPALVEALKKQFGFDRPLHERLWRMIKNDLTFNLGTSYFRGRSVFDLIVDKLPVSLSLGLWSALLTYMLSIPLGIAKAVRHGSRFDVFSSSVIVVGNAIPSFVLALLLVVLFTGGHYLDWFPMRGLLSYGWQSLPWPQRILDYVWHITLPVVSITVGNIASMAMLTKNSFLEHIHRQYVLTARSKGLTERQVLYKHVARNALLVIIAGFPAMFLSSLFTGVLLVEVIFSLDGLGRLGFEALVNRDYPIIFGTLYILTLAGLGMNIVTDVMYMFVDPRIDFGSRSA